MAENRNQNQGQSQGNRQPGEEHGQRQRDEQDLDNRTERERTQGREPQGTRSEQQGENRGQTGQDR